VAKRRGKNFFKKLRNKVKEDIIDVVCTAHTVHRAMETAIDCLPLDLENIFGKLDQHFHIYTSCMQTLKDFCDFVYVEFKNILGHVKT
jgi:hypothetical protein